MTLKTPAKQQQEVRNRRIALYYQKLASKGGMSTAIQSHLARKYALSASSIRKIIQQLK